MGASSLFSPYYIGFSVGGGQSRGQTAVLLAKETGLFGRVKGPSILIILVLVHGSDQLRVKPRSPSNYARIPVLLDASRPFFLKHTGSGIGERSVKASNRGLQ